MKWKGSTDQSARFAGVRVDLWHPDGDLDARRMARRPVTRDIVSDPLALRRVVLGELDIRVVKHDDLALQSQEIVLDDMECTVVIAVGDLGNVANLHIVHCRAITPISQRRSTGDCGKRHCDRQRGNHNLEFP